MDYTRETIEQQLQEARARGLPPLITGGVILAQENGGQPIDYRGLDLYQVVADGSIWKDLDLTAMQAGSASLWYAQFEKCTLNTARFENASLNTTSITETLMRRASLQHTTIHSSFFREVDLQHTRMDGNVFGTSIITSNTFAHCILSDVTFKLSHVEQNLFVKCALMRTNFQTTSCTENDWSGCDLTGANFSHANLTNSLFKNCTLDMVDLSHANLTGVCFTGTTDLCKANLSPILFCFMKVRSQAQPGQVARYQQELRDGTCISLPVSLGMTIEPNEATSVVERFTNGLIAKKNEAGEVDPRYTDTQVRQILIDWCNQDLTGGER